MKERTAELPCPSSLAQGLDPSWGFVHTEQTGSALDGPGLRTVVWLTGCGFRCSYCHNPDPWKPHAVRRVHADELVAEIVKYPRFMATSRGAVTVSGGEPLVEHGFCVNVLQRSHALGIHTALDSNGFLGDRLSDADLQTIDRVIRARSMQPARSLAGEVDSAPEPIARVQCPRHLALPSRSPRTAQ